MIPLTDDILLQVVSEIHDPVTTTDELIPSGENVVAISAKRKRGLDELLTAMEKALGKGKHRVKLCIPYADGYLLDVIHKEAAVFSTDYDADGTVVDIECDDKLYGQLKEYEVQDG